MHKIVMEFMYLIAILI